MLSKSLNCLWSALLESCLLGFHLISTYDCGVLNHGESFKYFPQIITFFLKKINSKLHTFQMYKKSNSSLLCNLPMKMKELFPVN